MARAQDRNVLKWHADRQHPGQHRAWAPALNPEDGLPPYYRLTRAVGRQPSRVIQLVRPRAVTGKEEQIIELADIGDNLSDAKATAQRDYERRIQGGNE